VLSAVYIKGFKTFARPVRMPLEGGITAVVGPNGSGKSNVTDAVLFALGEQSPGLLRAGSMGDLIFSGSDSLPAAAAAEVTLVLDNESGVISLPYAEVSITRRISRGGDADYRINGSRARLADVRAVAGEAGLGRHSILRQGAVDAIVAGGAAACRLALEEAAGLGVYRRRRISASRRLENADAQLEKSRQLESELADQLQRIEREATAAREYRELESRYRKLSLAYLYRVATKGLEDRRRQLAEGEARVSRLAEQEAGLRREEANFEPEIRAREARLRGLEKTLEGLEDLSERLQAEAARTDRASFRLENQRGGEGERARISARLEEELRKVSQALENLEGEAAALVEEHGKSKARLSHLQHERERARREYSETESKERRLSVRLEKLRARQDQRELPEAVLEEEEIGALSNLVEKLQKTSHESTNGGAESLWKSLQEHRRTLQERASEISRRRGTLDAFIGRCRSRIDALKKTEENSGAVLRLHEVIRARPGFENAVEAALGEAGTGILARDLAEGINLLSSTERVALRLDASGIEAHEPPPGRPLLECLEITDRGYAEAVERLLGGIYVVDGPESAPHNGYVAVTRDGLRLTRTSVSRRAAEGRFVREARLAEERDRLDALKSGPGSMLVGLQEAIGAAGERLRELDGEATAVSDLASRIDRAAALISREAGRRMKRATGSRQRMLERERNASMLEQEISAVAQELEASEQTVKRTKRRLNDAAAAANSGREEFEELDRRRNALRASISEGQKRREVISAELEKVGGVSDDAARRTTQLASRTAEVSRNLAANLRDRRARLREHRSEATEALRDLSKQRTALSRRSVELAGELATARAAAARLREELERDEQHASEASEEIQSEWGATIEAARQESEDLPEALEPERQRLARRIKRFGDVNLLALSQESQLRERHEFVSAQRADAEAAANELNRIILDVDREIETRFTETFGRVRGAFGEIVPRMLHGASGRMELSEEGVEIGLRLGRRGWRSLNVLSGGERALLALSFLFSIFLSRPDEDSGAFCMLDEAEAALDDVNLARFLAVVDSYRSGGQFILVTHQKRTMAAADVLYGVTQDASGATVVVSKRLSGE
jgi:chromosome segregation protein